jgi:hypothetical protein
VPLPKVNVPPAKPTLPVFVTVRVRALLVVPVAQLPNASGLGDTVAERVAARPVPVSETGEPTTGTLPVMVTVLVGAGPAAVGENTMPIVHVAPAANVPPHVPPAVPVGLENGAVTVTVIPVRAPPPVLCSVRAWDALVAPTTTFPNADGPPVTLAIA